VNRTYTCCRNLEIPCAFGHAYETRVNMFSHSSCDETDRSASRYSALLHLHRWPHSCHWRYQGVESPHFRLPSVLVWAPPTVIELCKCNSRRSACFTLTNVLAIRLIRHSQKLAPPLPALIVSVLSASPLTTADREAGGRLVASYISLLRKQHWRYGAVREIFCDDCLCPPSSVIARSIRSQIGKRNDM